MKIERGDVWDWHADGWWVVIPTNREIDKAGKAIMGAGLALQAKERFPDLPEWYAGVLGRQPRDRRMVIEPNPRHRLLMLPTKWRWRDNASLLLIQKGLWSIHDWIDGFEIEHEKQVVIPPLGCGYGNLPWSHVKPYFEQARIGDGQRTLIVVPPDFDLDR